MMVVAPFGGRNPPPPQPGVWVNVAPQTIHFEPKLIINPQFWGNVLSQMIRNLAPSTPPELICVSLALQESHLSNDAKGSLKGVDHAELWIIS